MNVQETADTVLFRPRKISYQDSLRPELDCLLARAGTRTLEIDLGEMKYLSAANLGSLLFAHVQLKKRGGRVVLANIPDDLMEVMEVCKLDRVFTIKSEEPPLEADPCVIVER